MRKRRPNKYGAIKTTLDGHRFDSKAEAARYSELVLLQRAGEIAHLAIHPSYPLQKSFHDLAGVLWRGIYYEADFSYMERNQDDEWHAVVEDVKGFRTRVFNLKEKLFRYKFQGVDFRIIQV